MKLYVSWRRRRMLREHSRSASRLNNYLAGRFNRELAASGGFAPSRRTRRIYDKENRTKKTCIVGAVRLSESERMPKVVIMAPTAPHSLPAVVQPCSEDRLSVGRFELAGSAPVRCASIRRRSLLGSSTHNRLHRVQRPASRQPWCVSPCQVFTR